MPEGTRPCGRCGDPVHKQHRRGRWPLYCTTCKSSTREIDPRDCSHCGGRFTPKQANGKYCSHRCGRAANIKKQNAKQSAARATAARFCACGTRLKHHSAVRCSTCRRASKRRTRTCEWCSTTYCTTVKHQRYCTSSCQGHAEKDRARQRRAEAVLTSVGNWIVTDQDFGRYKRAVRSDPCAYCGEPSTTLDHIISAARSGSGDWDNFTAACHSCNSSKGKLSLLPALLVIPHARAARKAREIAIQYRLIAA